MAVSTLKLMVFLAVAAWAFLVKDDQPIDIFHKVFILGGIAVLAICESIEKLKKQ